MDICHSKPDWQKADPFFYGLEKQYYFIPKQEKDKVQCVILYDKMNLPAKEQDVHRYMVFERRKDQEYTLIPKEDVIDNYEQPLRAGHLEHSTKFISKKIQILRGRKKELSK